jgi:uncharacterized protein YcfL
MKKYLTIVLIITVAITLLVGCTTTKNSSSIKSDGASKLLINIKYMQTTVAISKGINSKSVPVASENEYKSTNDVPYLLFKADGTGEFNVNYLDGVVCQPMTYTISSNIVTISFNQKCKIDVKITGKKTLECINTYQTKTGMTIVDDIFCAE